MADFMARFELYWDDIPVGKENAVTYAELCAMWQCDERRVRRILHGLSSCDNGDNYVLVRSAKGKGFFKTDDEAIIISYKQECLQKGRSVFAPVKKINRIMNNNADQFTFDNNLRNVREQQGLTQTAVCDYMATYDNAVNVPMLSKFENGACLPTPFQLARLAALYNVSPAELIDMEVI